ncbi:MAG: hypothetical protein M0Z45_09625 [Actinomycetota bacterium]|nr:hypothetical protein [Actinomycetota bacterium]
MDSDSNSYRRESVDEQLSRMRIVRKGFSPDEVRSALQSLYATQMRANETIAELKSQVAELSSRPQAAPVSELNEATVAKLLGDQAASILSTSVAASQAIKERADRESKELIENAKKIHDDATNTANELIRSTNENVAAIITRAQSDSRAIIEAAEATAAERLAAQEQTGKEVIERANLFATETVSNAQRNAEKILLEAQREATSMISSARETRTEILADLRMRADEVRGHIDTLTRTRGWFLELLQDAQRRVSNVESALAVSINSNLHALESSMEALNLSTIEARGAMTSETVTPHEIEASDETNYQDGEVESAESSSDSIEQDTNDEPDVTTADQQLDEVDAEVDEETEASLAPQEGNGKQDEAEIKITVNSSDQTPVVAEASEETESSEAPEAKPRTPRSRTKTPQDTSSEVAKPKPARTAPSATTSRRSPRTTRAPKDDTSEG